MSGEPRRHRVQLAVIGSGLAGCAAALFALERGLTTAQVGHSGALAYTSGHLDLLGVLDGRVVDDPWSALGELQRRQPGHPLARIAPETVRHAFHRFTAALSSLGIGYTTPGDRNLRAPTPAGTVKPTLSLPCTMAAGVTAARERSATLVVDFAGLEGFSARQLVANLGPRWPGLRCTRLDFPGMEDGGVLYPEAMARALEVPATRERLAGRIRAVLEGASCVGLPAILGIHRPDRVHRALQRTLGATLFEIPTMPPGVAGIRLQEAFEQALPARGLTLVSRQKVTRLQLGKEEATLQLHDSYGPLEIHAGAVLLATGRFLSGGLVADRDGIREPLLDLPVRQPPGRDAWHRDDYLAPEGHPVNGAGIRCDRWLRPLNPDGRVVHPRLFAAGILLAGQDWVRQRCGAGVAIATAFAAVQAAARHLGPGDGDSTPNPG